MTANLAALLYLIAGILFILALRGLSHPTTSRQGNLFGMVGMGIAVLTTLALSPPADAFGWVLVIAGIAIGAGVGAVVARRIAMTAMRSSSPPSLAGGPRGGAGRGCRALCARRLRHR